MKQYSFSIITPVFIQHQKQINELKRCIDSIVKQTYPKDFIEHIIINDGSILDVEIPLPNNGSHNNKPYPWVRVINQPNMQRITAYETGLKHARNEIICLLDADDKYIPLYLEKVNQMFNEYPDYKMFNFGSEHIHADGGKRFRDPFEPKELEVGHEIFGGGNIVNGTFVFKKEVYDDLGGFPDPVVKNIDCTDINYPAGGDQYIRDLTMASPYDFSAWFQLQFPETKQFFMVDVDSEPHKVLKEIGNPYGQDYALFYKYTRKYHSRPIKEYLYQVYEKS